MMNALYFDARSEQHVDCQIAELVGALRANAKVSRSQRELR